MDREKFINDFRIFLDENHDKIKAKMIKPEDLPADDDWRNDELWKSYNKREGLTNE